MRSRQRHALQARCPVLQGDWQLAVPGAEVRALAAGQGLLVAGEGGATSITGARHVGLTPMRPHWSGSPLRRGAAPKFE